MEHDGVTLAEVHCLAKCNGAQCEIKYGENVTEEEFRQDVILCCEEKITNNANDNDSRDDLKYLVVAYSRKHLNQTGSGHFSPIGWYINSISFVYNNSLIVN